MIKAIVFDFDGLIFDTETCEFNAIKEIYEEHNIDFPVDIWGKCIGTHADFFDPYGYLEEKVGKKLNHEQLRQLKKQKYDMRIEQEMARPGVEEYLIAAKNKGLKIGLASSSSRNWVEGYLRHLNLLHYFDCVRTSDDVKTVKPDPELYVKALQCLGVEPHEAVAFEDSPNGALAAKRAGMYCVIVPNSVTTALPFGEVDMRLESMLEMQLEKLIEHFSGKRGA